MSIMMFDLYKGGQREGQQQLHQDRPEEEDVQPGQEGYHRRDGQEDGVQEEAGRQGRREGE